MEHAAYFVMAAYVFVGDSFVQRLSNYKKARVSPANIHMLQVSHLDNQLNRFTLLMSPLKTLINWLQANNFLASSMQCDQCRADCVLNGRSWNTYGYTWCCKSRHEVSIRKYSFFSKSHLYIPDIYSTSLKSFVTMQTDIHYGGVLPILHFTDLRRDTFTCDCWRRLKW